MIRSIVFAVAALVTTFSWSAELKLLGSGAVREIVAELLPTLEKDLGYKVAPTWTGGADIRRRVAAGESYDVIISNAPDLDTLAKHGKVRRRIDLMESSIGVAVPLSAPKPDVSSAEALRATLLAAKQIGYSTGPSGVHIETLVRQMGIADQVQPKMRQVPSGIAVGSLIAASEVDIGFQQVSELIHYPGVAYLGPIPREVQYTTVYSAAVSSTIEDAARADAFIGALRSPGAATVMREHGMSPKAPE
jgi:molybdate transport system substrate-binding protein